MTEGALNDFKNDEWLVGQDQYEVYLNDRKGGQAHIFFPTI
jgi:hypothetical protein